MSVSYKESLQNLTLEFDNVNKHSNVLPQNLSYNAESKFTPVFGKLPVIPNYLSSVTLSSKGRRVAALNGINPGRSAIPVMYESLPPSGRPSTADELSSRLRQNVHTIGASCRQGEASSMEKISPLALESMLPYTTGVQRNAFFSSSGSVIANMGIICHSIDDLIFEEAKSSSKFSDRSPFDDIDLDFDEFDSTHLGSTVSEEITAEQPKPVVVVEASEASLETIQTSRKRRKNKSRNIPVIQCDTVNLCPESTESSTASTSPDSAIAVSLSRSSLDSPLSLNNSDHSTSDPFDASSTAAQPVESTGFTLVVSRKQRKRRTEQSQPSTQPGSQSASQTTNNNLDRRRRHKTLNPSRPRSSPHVRPDKAEASRQPPAKPSPSSRPMDCPVVITDPKAWPALKLPVMRHGSRHPASSRSSSSSVSVQSQDKAHLCHLRDYLLGCWERFQSEATVGVS